MNTGKTIRIPAYMVELLTKWRRASAQLQEELGRTPTNEEIARSMNLSKKKLAIIKKAIRVYNAGPQADQADDGWSLDETRMDGRARTPDAEMLESDDLRQALTMLDKLEDREAAVLRLRFGLDGEDPKTLKEIGEILGLTREHVRRSNEALGKLRRTGSRLTAPDAQTNPSLRRGLGTSSLACLRVSTVSTPFHVRESFPVLPA